MADLSEKERSKAKCWRNHLSRRGLPGVAIDFSVYHDKLAECAAKGMTKGETLRALNPECGKGSFYHYCNRSGIVFRPFSLPYEKRKERARQLELKRAKKGAAKLGVSVAQYRHLVRPSAKWTTLVSGLRARSKLKNLPFNLTAQYLRKLWDEQNNKCALTGWDLVYSRGTGKKFYNTMSVDRIVPELGYTCGNTRLVALAVNALKMTWSDRQLFELCQAVINHRGRV